MFLCTMLPLLVSFLVAVHGVAALNPVSSWPGVYQDFQWRAHLCCEQPSAGPRFQSDASASIRTQTPASSISPIRDQSPASDSYQCLVQNSTNDLNTSTESHSFSAECFDVLCHLGDEQTNLICFVKYRRAPGTSTRSKLTVSLQQAEEELSINPDEPNHTTQTQCSGEDAVKCSVAVHAAQDSVSLLINGSINDFPLLTPTMHISTDQLRKPEPPYNLHHNVTIQGEVMFMWNDSQSSRYPRNYELRYTSNPSLKLEVFRVQHPWVALTKLSSGVSYTVQVRAQNPQHLQHWSDWSQPLYLSLDVSYIPAEVMTQPGAEVTVYGIFHNHSVNASKAVWIMNNQVIPESQYTVVSERVSAVTIRPKDPGFDSLLCCYLWDKRPKCGIAYAKIYTEGYFDANITCQAKQESTDSMTCQWNKSAWALVRFLYQNYSGMCENNTAEKAALTTVQDDLSPGVKECPDGVGDFRQCTLKEFSVVTCYKLWLVVEGGHGTVRSRPVLVYPYYYVKPARPSILRTATFPNRTLWANWSRPSLPAYQMQYELRYAPAQGMADTKVFGPVFEPWAVIPVQEHCVQYMVQVRCRGFNISGFWSDWSEPHRSSVNNSEAPAMGPDFWRVIQEDATKNHSNVTLLLKPVPVQDPSICVQGLTVYHASGGVLWSNNVPLSSFYTFQWKEDVHSITVMAYNSVGYSAKNSNMTLHRSKRQFVRSFHASANATCVSLSWTLLSEHLQPTSFVIEWMELNADPGQGSGRLQWLRVPSTTRDTHICRHFYGSEEFRLYPVFADGEGEPVRCIAAQSDPAAYMLLMIIAFLSVVLFVTLIISQNQIKKLMWKDVPNPNNCSWAKGMDFKKLEGTDNLFGYSEGLTACPLLLMSESVCEAEIVVKPSLLTLEKNQEKESLLHGSGDVEGKKSSELSTVESSVEPLSLDTSTVSATPETSGQSSVSYSAVLVFDQPVLVRKQQENLSSSSDEGNFSANNSDISGSFPGGLWELENPPCSDGSNPRNSSSYNSVEEFSEQEDEASESRREVKELYYLGMNEEDEEEEKDFQVDVADDADDETVLCGDSSPESTRKCSGSSDSSSTSQTSIPLYLPQFRTGAAELLREHVENSALQL